MYVNYIHHTVQRVLLIIVLTVVDTKVNCKFLLDNLYLHIQGQYWPVHQSDCMKLPTKGKSVFIGYIFLVMSRIT